MMSRGTPAPWMRASAGRNDHGTTKATIPGRARTAKTADQNGRREGIISCWTRRSVARDYQHGPIQHDSYFMHCRTAICCAASSIFLHAQLQDDQEPCV